MDEESINRLLREYALSTSVDRPTNVPGGRRRVLTLAAAALLITLAVALPAGLSERDSDVRASSMQPATEVRRKTLSTSAAPSEVMVPLVWAQNDAIRFASPAKDSHESIPVGARPGYELILLGASGGKAVAAQGPTLLVVGGDGQVQRYGDFFLYSALDDTGQLWVAKLKDSSASMSSANETLHWHRFDVSTGVLSDTYVIGGTGDRPISVQGHRMLVREGSGNYVLLDQGERSRTPVQLPADYVPVGLPSNGAVIAWSASERSVARFPLGSAPAMHESSVLAEGVPGNFAAFSDPEFSWAISPDGDLMAVATKTGTSSSAQHFVTVIDHDGAASPVAYELPFPVVALDWSNSVQAFFATSDGREKAIVGHSDASSFASESVGRALPAE